MYFSVNGVNIELLNAPKSICKFLINEIGFFKLDIYPNNLDISIKFVDRFSSDTFLNKDLFFIKDSELNTMGLSMDILKKTQIICERSFNCREFYEWLEIVMKYKIIKNKAVFLHASSFVYKDKGIVVCAWINGGKTNALLDFLSKGAFYLSDEFTIITEKGEILAYPKRIDLRDFNLMVLPNISKNLDFKKRMLFRLALLEKGFLRILYNLGFKSIAKIGMDVAFSMRLSLKEIFPKLKVVKNHQLDRIFFLLESNVSKIQINKMNKEGFINKILATNIFERGKFIKNSKAYSSLTGKEIDFENLHKKEREILSSAIEPNEIYEVLIPKTRFSSAIKEIEKLI